MRISRRYSASSACCGCLLGSLLPFHSALADWETVSDVLMAVEANDNPRLGQRPEEQLAEPDVSDDHTSVRAFVDGRFNLENRGPRGVVLLQPRFRVDTYADDEDDDLQREDLYLNGRAAYRWRRTSAELRANLSRESILSSEILGTDVTDPGGLDPVDPVDPVESDTGALVLLNEHRVRTQFVPRFDFAMSERSSLLLEARYLDIGYTGPELRGRTDFTDTGLALGVNRTIDDRTSAAALLIVSNFEAEATQNETDTVGVEGSFGRELNEFWSFDLTTGLQRSEFSFVEETGEVIDNAATSFTMSVGFRKRTEISDMSISLARLLNPNAVGFLVERNELRLGYNRQMSERLSAGIGVRLMETDALDRADEFQGRDFTRVDLDLEWAMTPNWFLTARYGLVDQEFSGQRPSGDANLLTLGATYRGLSRNNPATR